MSYKISPKFSIGSILSKVENGSVEYDGHEYYVTLNDMRYKIETISDKCICIKSWGIYYTIGEKYTFVCIENEYVVYYENYHKFHFTKDEFKEYFCELNKHRNNIIDKIIV